MTKEALKLALEALEDLGMKHYESTGEVLYKETFTAIKQAIANEALEKKAENARELGLDYEPERTWVGLTDEEIKAFDTWHDNREEEVGWVNPSEIVAYIEAKLKEKNT